MSLIPCSNCGKPTHETSKDQLCNACLDKLPQPHPKIEDMVNHPIHYTSHPSGVECIRITEHMNFNLGNALKYIWRADLKNDPIENLKKAQFYLNREIQRRQNESHRTKL